MGQDIRKMMRDYKPGTPKLSEGHEKRFAARLDAEMSKTERPVNYWLKIAAVVIAFVAVGSFAYFSITDKGTENSLTTVDNSNTEATPESVITLGDLSPDLKKVESYYTTGINVQLASLKVNDDNKELVDSYMKRLNELNAEYEVLNKELNEVGPNEATITALVENLQLRLEMLFKLKNKLEELKKQNNENYTI